MAKLAESVYSDALFELAMEKGCLQERMEEAQVVDRLLSENPELLRLLRHPQIEKGEKAQILENIFRGRVSDDLTGLLLIAVSKGHADVLSAIIRSFIKKGKRQLHIGEAEVVSAAVLTEEQERRIRDRLLQLTDYERLEVEYRVDPSLIGGLVIRMDNRVVDSSIQTKLDRLAGSLKQIQLGKPSQTDRKEV